MRKASKSIDEKFVDSSLVLAGFDEYFHIPLKLLLDLGTAAHRVFDIDHPYQEAPCESLFP